MSDCAAQKGAYAEVLAIQLTCPYPYTIKRPAHLHAVQPFRHMSHAHEVWQGPLLALNFLSAHAGKHATALAFGGVSDERHFIGDEWQFRGSEWNQRRTLQFPTSPSVRHYRR